MKHHGQDFYISADWVEVLTVTYSANSWTSLSFISPIYKMSNIALIDLF
jgi:hypothetical protein